MLLQGPRGWSGEEFTARAFLDRWGFLAEDVRRQGARAPVWIHMISGGEVLIGWGLLQRLAAEDIPLMLSTESHDAFELLRRHFGREHVAVPPWDLAMPVGRHLRALRPRAVVFVQNAYYPVLIARAKRAGIPTALVNGLFSRDVFGVPHMQRAIALGFHRDLDAVAVQDANDDDAARDLGVSADRLAITGDMYADLRHLRLTPPERARRRRELGCAADDRVVVVGSTHPAEEDVLQHAFVELRRRRPDVRFIVAPRQLPTAAATAERFRARGWRVALRTEVARGAGAAAWDLLILDTFGELAALYGVGDAAYIGASLVPFNARRAGHNMLEPLVHGVVPVFGPHMERWRHVIGRVAKVAPTLEVESADALAERLDDVLAARVPLDDVRRVADEIIDEQGGAIDRTRAFLRERIGL